jgi:DNA primase
VLEIPGSLDPDEFIRQSGAPAYRKLLDSAVSYFHWLADRARTKFDMRSAEGRVDAFKYLWPSIQQVSDRIERSAIAREVAEYLNVDLDVIRQQFQRTPVGAPPQKPRDLSAAVPPNEKLLLACLLASAEARATVRHYLASSNFLHLLEFRNLFEVILRFDEEEQTFSLETVAQSLEERARKILAEISFADLGVEEEGASAQALHCLRALETKGRSTRYEALKQQIREQEQAGNFPEALRLADELNAIKRQNLQG